MKIAVCMIVSNEQKVIERCFDSFSEYISAYIINDNDPEAKTTPIIEKYFEKRNVPGKVYKDPWVNFSHNRNLALEYGRKYIQEELNENPKNWYLLMVDADYTLTINNPNWVNNLKLPNYSFRHSGYFDYSECILFRADKNWRYALVTHECPILPGESYQTNVNLDVTINHYCDGGSRSTKFQRDIKLITEELKKEIPTGDRIRYTYYLARSYDDTRDYKNAIKFYEKRINFGGWQEEIYYSMYRIGVCMAKMATTLEQNMNAITALMDAYYYRPQRLEAIYEAAELFFNMEMVQLAIPLLKMCLSTSYPSGDILMIHREIYDWKALYLYTRATLFLGLKEKSLYLYICDQNDKMPEDHKKFLKEREN